MNNVSKEYIIFRKPKVDTNGEMRKSNMIIKYYDKSYKRDVIIHYENDDSLMNTYRKLWKPVGKIKKIQGNNRY